MNLEADQNLSHYRLICQIGQGGMGVVWKAVDTRLDREVAIKILATDKATGLDRLKRFEREAKAVAALNHPNIVTLYSVEEAEGLRFITMELVSGRTLAEIIPKHGVTLAKFFEVSVPLVDALSAAHKRGIIHRDLKPANIMINEEGRLKILDFGLAKLREQIESVAAEDTKVETRSNTLVTVVGHVMGTAPYMSPEQVQGKALDHRTDIFSVGVIFHELATGKRPFHGSNSADLISAILRDSPSPVTETKIGFPNHVSRIVRHCLEKDADRRYQSAQDLCNDLEGLKLEVATGELPKPITRRRQVNPLLAISVLIAVAALVALGFWLRRGPAVESGHPAIAVLPFANLTGSPDRDYLSEGLSAGLISRLAEVSGVRVAGRSATWGGNAAKLTPRRLASQLGVSLFVEGEVQQSAEGLKVDVKLTDPDSGLVLWSRGFEGQAEELFVIQRDITRQLAAVLEVPLSSKEIRRLALDPTGSFKAYDFYLRGQQHLGDFTDERSIDTGIEMFRQAIRLDPEFALAHVGLSEALWWSYLLDSSGDKLVEAEKEVLRALDIDPGLPAALVELARVYRSTGRYSASIDELQKVLANHPKPDEAQRELAASYERVGDLEEAERCLRAAATLGENDWYNGNALGSLLSRLGRYDEAREAFQQAADVAPKEIAIPLKNLAALTIQQGRFDEAIEAYERIPPPIREPSVANNLGTAYYFSDRPDKWEKAEEYYQLAVRLSPRNAEIRRNLADLYQEIGRRDDALHNYREAMLLIAEQLQVDPTNQRLRLEQAIYAAKAAECPIAIGVAAQLVPELPETASNEHQLAHVYAMCGERDSALKALGTAVRLGVSREIIRQEPEFESLREDPDFLALVAPEEDS